MTTTSLLPHKPPPLKPRNNPAVFLRSNYYGSIGRPSSGKRKSAVELLEETKAFYVKSESVLDAKQELKNADHLHVRSPTVDVATMLRSPAPPLINGGGPFPFAMCLTCPPYPHQHFEHFDHYQLHQNAHNHHLSQGSLHHQQQHHLSTCPPGGGGGGNSSGPPSVESGGTASTGSTGGGGGVTAISSTLGRSSSSKHHHHSHHHSSHHNSHNHNNHNTHIKSHRSSSTGSSGSRHLSLQDQNTSILIEASNLIMSSKPNTGGRTRRSQPPGSLAVLSSTTKINSSNNHHGGGGMKKDSANVLATLLPGMSFTLPAQSSLHKHHHSSSHHHHHHQQQHHHHSHHHPLPHPSHHHQLQHLQHQQQTLASLSNSTSAALSLPNSASNGTTGSAAAAATTTTTNNAPANHHHPSTNNPANGVRNSATDKHSSTNLVSTAASSGSAQQNTSAGQSNGASSGVVGGAGVSLKTGNHGTGHHRERNGEDDSPPPLPPKSPRITSKPARPHDFPQQLQLQVVDSSVESAALITRAAAATTAPGGGTKSSSIVPPQPPPRRHSQVESSQAKYLRLLQDQSTGKLSHAILEQSQSMTLPSPILPPTPPPDVVMESPMSDSGPIISPPPAFSTPVTPMIDRQNSTTSDKSGVGGGVQSSISQTQAAAANASSGGGPGGVTTRLRSLSQSAASHYHNITGFTTASSSPANGSAATGQQQSKLTHSTSQQQTTSSHHYHAPLTGTVSMSAISSVNGRSGGTTRNNKSIPDLSSDNVSSLRYSPMSRSRSNSSPMTPEESIPATSPEEDEDDEDEDDDVDEDPTSSSLADNGHDGDDDCSEKGQSSAISPKLITSGVVRRNSAKHLSHHHQPPLPPPPPLHPKNNKITLIPKSVTENFLYKVGNATGTTTTTNNTSTGGASILPGAPAEDNDPVKMANTGAQTEANQQSRIRTSAEAPSPARRPILRSKSDLSHRYAKVTEKSATLTPGFTLVHVDLGQPPPLPMHNSISSNDFSAPTPPVKSSSNNHHGHHYSTPHHQHHIYQTPTVSTILKNAASSTTTTSHYQEPSLSKRTTKSASDLERFFDMLGLEQSSNTQTPAPLSLADLKEGGSHRKSGSESPVFFSSVSSVDSAPRRSGSADSEDSPLDDKHGSRTVGYGKLGPSGTLLVQHGEPSIVERNARVIKWLFNCRKALERR